MRQILWPLLFLLGCATKPEVYLSNPLVKKQLAPMVGFKTLTNVSQNLDGSLKVEQYDLNDVEVRRTLRQLDFRCNVGGLDYYICAGGPGLCRRIDDSFSGWGPWRKTHVNLAAPIDLNERYQFLIDAKTRCESSRVEDIR